MPRNLIKTTLFLFLIKKIELPRNLIKTLNPYLLHHPLPLPHPHPHSLSSNHRNLIKTKWVGRMAVTDLFADEIATELLKNGEIVVVSLLVRSIFTILARIKLVFVYKEWEIFVSLVDLIGNEKVLVHDFRFLYHGFCISSMYNWFWLMNPSWFCITILYLLYHDFSISDLCTIFSVSISSPLSRFFFSILKLRWFDQLMNDDDEPMKVMNDDELTKKMKMKIKKLGGLGIKKIRNLC